MICKACGSSKASLVLETRERQDFVYRKRKCTVCGYEYMTHERFARGCRTMNGTPRLLYLNELENRLEAVWLEYRITGRVTATAIARVTSDAVYFDNGTYLSKESCLHMWRVWDKRPDSILRESEEWQ